MKKILFCLLFLLSACNKTAEEPAKITFFYKELCPHCHHAREYIHQNYAALPIEMVDIATPEGYELLVKAVNRYKISGSFGVPFIAFGENYMLGWGGEVSEKTFDEYAKPFLQQNK